MDQKKSPGSLVQWSEGDSGALDRLIPVVYDELRQIAERYFRRERPDNTLQPTALVNEVYIRLVNQSGVSWQNRAHFFGIAPTTVGIGLVASRAFSLRR